MSTGYTWVQWNRHKRIYDAVAASAVVLFVGTFVVVSALRWRDDEAISSPILVMRALGLCAFLLLNIILCIGPLARLDARFLPLLYNRRHLGVLTFLVALTHAVIAVGYYHGFGVVNPILSLLAGNTNVTSLSAFPFQLLGLGALLILFLLAATSHDFWLKNLSPGMWKRLHMLVYFAYFLLIGHISLGALQNHRGTARPALLLVGVTSVCGLHLATGIREVRRDRATRIGAPAQEMWIDAGPVAQIPPNRARVVSAPGGERIAVFKHGDTVSAVTNVCAHQNGPLGEGKVIDGCITCPWHGWQYRPTDGRSPPPFTEKIATYRVRVVAGNAQVDPRPLPAGTPVDPAPCNRSAM